MHRKYLIALVGLAAVAMLFIAMDSAEAEPINVRDSNPMGSSFVVSWRTTSLEDGNVTWRNDTNGFDPNNGVASNSTTDGSNEYLHYLKAESQVYHN